MVVDIDDMHVQELVVSPVPLALQGSQVALEDFRLCLPVDHLQHPFCVAASVHTLDFDST